MNNKAKHPAMYSDILIPVIGNLVAAQDSVLDPFAGTGKIALIKNYGFKGILTCNEMEEEWIDYTYPVDEWHIGDAEFMDWAADESFSCICTSPVYGNRLSDHYVAKDKSERRSYRSFLGKDLNTENTGRMQWGNDYREKHRRTYLEFMRVLKDTGIFILNISDHIRDGKIVKVTDWHKEALWEIGFAVDMDLPIPTPRYRHGENNKLRVDHESIVVFKKRK